MIVVSELIGVVAFVVLTQLQRQIGMRMRRRVPTAVGNSECITTDDKENHVYQTSERTRHNARLKGLECAPRNN